MAPHFKKLTECPENLREAIDWLIQVRHGSGNGLGELAKALKKLVEEAIEKAYTTNVDALLKLFNSAKSYNCCKDKVAEIEEHKDSKNPENNLFNDLKTKCADIRNCNKSHLDDSQQKAYVDITSKLEQLDGLNKSLIGLTDENQCKMLLTNLCDGLETFLGFNPSSKGYDGSGIVYSDLDRLCDAVMGFLSGVLDAVKDDDAVKTYDTDKSRDINTVISTLNNKIGSGRTGLVDSVGAVKRWLEGYEREVKEKTGEVINLLNDIDDEINTKTIHRLTGDFDNVDKAVSQFLIYASKKLASLQRDGNVITKIDPELQKMLKPSIDLVAQGVKHMEITFKHNYVRQAVKTVKEAYNTLPQHVENFIDTSVNSAVDCHKLKVEDLKKIVDSEVKRLRNKFLHESLAVSREDLMKAITTFSKNAYNLGGLKNKTVRQAIDEIEKRLQSVDDNVSDEGSLSSENVSEQLQTIIGEVNEGKASHDTIRNIKELKTTIGEPKNVFVNHETKLKQLVDQAREDLEKALDCAKNNAKNLGGLENAEVKVAIAAIQGKFDGLDRQQIDTFKELKDLKDIFMDEQVKTITEALNDVNAAPIIISELQNLDQHIIHPDKIFDSEHAPTLLIAARKAQEDLENAIENAMKFVNSSQGSLQRKIEQTFEKVLEEFRKGITDVDQLKNKIDEEIQKISRVSDKFNAGKRHEVVLELEKLNRVKIDSVKSLLQVKSSKVSESDIDSWYERSNNLLHTYVLEKANVEIAKADQAYQQMVNKQLQMIRKQILTIQSKSKNHQFGDMSDFESLFVPILAAVGTNSVYNDDREAREQYFNNLMTHTSDIVSNLNAAYKKAYKTAARSYLSGSIKKIKTFVNDSAEQLYERLTAEEIKKVRTAVRRIQADIFKNKNQRNLLREALIKPFPELLKQVKKSSAFKTDSVNRTLCFQELESLIIHTFDTLSIAYEKAYKSSAKTYLSKSISKIKVAVKNAEQKYELAVKTQTAEIKNILTFMDDSMFRSRGQSKKKELGDLFKKSFEALLSAIKDNTAFKTDLEYRIKCFSNLESLITNIVSSLVDAAITFDRCFSKAQDHLRQSFENARKGYEKLGADVKAKVHNALEIMKADVQVMYAAHKTIEFDTLKASIKVRLEVVKGIIEQDAVTGIKGLMKSMRENDNQLTELKIQETVKEMSPVLSAYLRPLFSYVFHDVENSCQSQAPNTNVYSPQVHEMFGVLETILDHLKEQNHYDHQFAELLDQFNTHLGNFNPSSSFSQIPLPLLQIIKQCMTSFTAQLDLVYINRYSSAEQIGPLVTNASDPDKVELTKDGRNCAKVCLTLISTLNNDLSRVRVKCSRGWSYYQIHEGVATILDRTTGKPSLINNPLGPFFKKCGYKVSDTFDKQNGELRNKKECNGKAVYDCLAGTDYSYVFNTDKDFEYPLQKLYDCLQDYYAVGHYATAFAKKQPCNVYEMCNWVCGLKYNPVQSDLLHSISDMLEEPATPVGGDGDLVTFDLQSFYINTYPNRATYKQLDEVINHIMSKSAFILTTVLGYGDEQTTYACDFYDNSSKLYYPKSGEDCLDMLLDIMRRMLPPLRFLFMQCRLDESHYGWADCYYGENVYPLNWQCKNHEAGTANCRPRSALQSYLSDCLVGCMPHQLSAIGCKATCTTCPKGQPGMPCLTPLGFRGFSGGKRRGEDLSNVLGNLFGNPLLASLFALAPKAPSTLPEHFQFALSLVYDWQNNRSHPIENGIKAAIMDRSTALYEQTSDLTNALSNAYGSSQTSHDAVKYHATAAKDNDEENQKGDLASLSMSTACPDQLCAPYLYALCTDQYDYLAKTQCKTYLSWAVYLPWTLWNYLNSLYNSFKDIYCQDWGCRSCLRADTCRRGQHGLVNDKTKAPNCHCDSIVDCKGAMPTLYKYGFTFGAPAALNAKDGSKTCTDFMSQLNNVLQSTYFQTLFRECDNFLWKIREPFTWTVVALWLLSLLYLLHIMVIRLDLLHIKSHLHSPSSHRIAAQSLLAAARVGKLSRISYLQA